MKPGFFTMWSRRDWEVGAGCGLTAALVYFWTAAPNVTLLDSGEFLVASGHFGIPHPTGYPLWTILCGLFQLLPLGNTAWEGNLFSGVCGGLAVGLAAALLHQSLGWLFQTFAEERGVSPIFFSQVRLILTIAVSLSFAFSQPMWSQATITEVYTLHALLVRLYVTSLYRWMRDPRHLGGLVASVFFWALGMSNHHLVLVLLPLTIILVLLLRSDVFPDFLIFLMAAGALVTLAFAALSDDVATQCTASRFAYCVGAALLILAWLRRGQVRWILLPSLILAVGAGFLPYLYMPLASSTNPPLNWGYTKQADGFYFSINRSQYSGSLNGILNDSLGRVLGSRPAKVVAPTPDLPGLQENSYLGATNLFAGFFWIQLTKSLTPLLMVSFFVTLLAILYLSPPGRAWILLIYVSFILAGFFEPFVSRARIDQGGWLLQMPYHTYSFALFALVSGTGLFFSLIWIRSRISFSVRWTLLLLVLPVYGLFVNYDFCSQRGKWFGWEFGHKILKDMPPGSILFGGTDPGRFVPTYMIFSESFEPAAHKKDPDFDRRDIYIITQNALVDVFYWKTLRDQYGPERPEVKNSFERWLGRERVYPKEKLVLPSDQEVKQSIAQAFSEEERPGGKPSNATSLNGPIAQWIFEKNKDRHVFFVEESFPMPWTYPYAIPQGLIYRLNSLPMAELSPQIVKDDREFWSAYCAKLLKDPLFLTDIDAQRSFSKLRTTTGNIYRFRQKEAQKANQLAVAASMRQEAELAYRQALNLWAINPEAVQFLLEMMTEEGRTKEALDFADEVLRRDPFNNELFHFNQVAYLRDKWQGEIRQWESKRKDDPSDSEAILKLIDLYLRIEDGKAGGLVIEGALKTHPKDRTILQAAIHYYLQNGQRNEALQLARYWEKVEPHSDRVAYLVSRLIFLAQGNTLEFQRSVTRAVELGREDMKEEYRSDPIFNAIIKDGALEKLLLGTDSGKAPF